ncbi:MAG: AAA family ATPase [Chloroflexota bacterium]|nr:AAA family ATPase [Chloroflexota bacterium]
MRITKVAVKKLFGIFDHEIPLNQDSRITIIHGPNGVGKTVLMRMIDGLLRRDYQVFVEVPFKEFKVQTDNDEEYKVSKQPDEQQPDDDLPVDEDREHYPFEICYSISGIYQGSPYRPRRYREDDARERSLVVRALRRLHGLEYVGANRWLDAESGDVLSFQDATERFDVYPLPGQKDEFPWLKSLRDKMESRLIRAERLSVMRPDVMQYREFGRHRSSTSVRMHTVEELSKDIVQRIDDTTEQFAKKSNELDSTFPQHVIDEGRISIDNELQKEIQQLDDHRTRLEELGLLEEQENTEDDTPARSRSAERADSAEALQKIFLSTYVQDIRAKLDTFDAIYGQLSLLTSIINKRFENKKLDIHRRNGFIITGHDNKDISLSSLSSGEQHELVLLYQLLLQTKENSLIMIDEPELSLHVEWQRDFLNDLENIIETRKFDVLIATHSPQIVDDKWDWMEYLGDTEEENA